MTEIVESPGYGADDMTLLEGLDAVRKRPGMYIGSTDSKGLNHLVWEIIDNSVDEALGGHATRIDVTLAADGSVTVEDNGRGIPTGINTKTGLSGVELALTKLHAGGKFGNSGYKSAGGLHGVGSSVVNALSVRMDAIVYQNNKEHKVSFQRGKTGVFAGETPDAKFKAEPGLKVSPDKRSPAVKKERKTGTTVRWWHDPAIFLPGSALDIEAILNRARTTAFLVAGLTLAIHDNREAGKETSEVFQFTGGIVDMVDYLAPDQKLIDPVFVDTTAKFSEVVPVLNADGHMESTEVEREVEIKVAFRWGTEYASEVRSFVNVVNTPHGGTHVKGFERGLLKAVTDNAKLRRGLLKAGEANPIFEDVSEGLTAVVYVGLSEPQFLGQTKEALGTNAVTKLVQTEIGNAFNLWLNNKKNAAASKTVLEKIVNASRNRLAQRELKETNRKKSALESSSSMPPKLVDCEMIGHEDSELLLVEGDSALGTMRGARDSRFQALLPLRGKVLNVYKATPAAMLANKECAAMIQVMGAGSGRTFDLEAIRYGKVIIETDADVDGAHIKALLITFFWKYMQPFVEAGKLYAAIPPLYAVKVHGKSGEVFYAVDGQELLEITKKLDARKVKYDINRNKGLGEMDVEPTWDTLLNPATRQLKQIVVDDIKDAQGMLELAMGSEVPPRKEWITDSRHKLTAEELDG